MRSAPRRAALILFLVATATACSRIRNVEIGVPDRSRRDSVFLALAEPQRTQDAQAAAAKVACLIRGGDAENCRENTPCNVKKTAAILTSEFLPLLTVIKDLDFSSQERARPELKRLFPNASIVLEVSDARRTQRCPDRGAGACMAVGYQNVWLLLGARGDGNRVERIDVFLSGKTCADKPMGGV